MVCEHCQTEHAEDAIGACPTCGAAFHGEDDQATRVLRTPAASSPDNSSQSDLNTRVLRSAQPPPPDSRAAESDLATFAGPQRSPSSPQPSHQSPPAPSGLPASSLHGWTSATPAEGMSGALCLMPGAVLGGRYEILKSLGEGGMGSVYKARDFEVNRLVAIKIIRAELANDPLIVQRFKQELVLSSQVTHRNVVRIYDLGAANGLRFISMEYIDGRELSEVLRERGKFDPKLAADVILQVCRGLEAAHAQGVIHRDLKPQNIMLDAQGRAAVMDFGIARSAQTGAPDEENAAPVLPGLEGLTQVGSLLGTPRYMSPEQANKRPLDARSDIYTVGLIFYELLTGRSPFTAATVKELLLKRGMERVVPIAEVDPSVPKRLDEIALKCLESVPDRRYQSVSELIADLEVWLGIRTLHSRRFNRWTALALSLALLASVAAGLLVRERLALNASRAHRPVTVLISDFHNGAGQPVFDGVVEPMFQVAIEGASFISAFNRGQAHKDLAAIQAGAKTLDGHLASLVAIRDGIGVVLGGALERTGSGFRLTATATEAGGKLLSTDSADFTVANDLPKAVDKVASRIRRALGDVTNSGSSAAETFTSGSLASAQKYAAAQQLQWDGKWAEAVAAYREATALDPKMSRAYAGIAATLANLGRRQEAEHYYQLALANINRESDREKYRTRGGYYLLMRNYQKAADQFSELVKQYPVDSAGLANLALAYFYGRNMTAALEQGRKAVQIYPQNILQRNNVGLYAMYAGDFDAAIKESQSIIKLSPSFEKAYLCLGISELQRGSPKDAAADYAQLSRLSDWGASEAALALGDLAIYQGRYADAVSVLQRGIVSDRAQKNSGSAAVKLVALASAQLHRKERAQALKSAAEAAASNQDESVLYSAAELDLQAAETAPASALAKKLGDRFEPEPRALAKLIEGQTQMQSGKLHEAVASFEDARKLADTWLGRFNLGRAYLAAKLYPEAENEFDICIKRRGEASAAFLDDEPTVRFVPAVYYYLGLARAGLHSSAAVDDFNTFLGMKRESDPDPMVSDAKRRLQAQ